MDQKLFEPGETKQMQIFLFFSNLKQQCIDSIGCICCTQFLCSTLYTAALNLFFLPRASSGVTKNRPENVGSVSLLLFFAVNSGFVFSVFKLSFIINVLAYTSFVLGVTTNHPPITSFVFDRY